MKTNTTTGKFACRFIAALATVLVWTVSAAAQTVVVGTGNADVDVPAVQAAVDQGGDVILRLNGICFRKTALNRPAE